VPLNLAALYLQLGLWEQAAAQAGDYLEQRRGGRFERYARYLKALALIGQSKGRDAEELLLSVRAGHGFGPPAEEVAYHLARAAESLGDRKREAAYLAQAEKNFKDPARLLWIRQRLGQFWAQQGDGVKATHYYRRSLEPCGDSAFAEPCAESSLRLADSEFRRDPRQALAVYGEILRRYPQHKEASWAQYQVGNIHKSLGDWEAALNAYRRVIDNYPYSYWAAQAKWQTEDAVWRKEYEGVLD
jgi:tetratricopeptide (TPR) repeat protein